MIGHKRDGRCVYDARAKAELVAECGKPGVSVSRLARDCGVNANQLSRWVREHERALAAAAAPTNEMVATAAFVPMRLEAGAPDQAACAVHLQVRLPNGVIIDLQGCDVEHAGELIEALGRLRCSVSTKA